MALVAEDYVKLAEADSEAETPQTLYHTLLTVIDYEADATGAARTVYPLGTHTSLEAAKAFAAGPALQGLGYARDDFETYETRSPTSPEPWTHGDGTVVYARRAGPHAFLVSLATTPNNEALPAQKPGGGGDKAALVALPTGADHLHYVLQTRVDYNADRSGGVQSTEVEGVYARRADALAAARGALLSDEVRRADFAEYDERGDEVAADEWPYGDDVLVHAVAQTGENYRVAVRTVPGCHQRHGKHALRK